MSHLIDTSLWIEMYKDRTGKLGLAIEAQFSSKDLVFARPIGLEILQGCSTQQQYDLTREYLAAQTFIEMSPDTWVEASRIYFDLKRAGKTVRSSLDCCIAQLAIENEIDLIHNDRDFETIATIRPLKHRRLDLSKV